MTEIPSANTFESITRVPVDAASSILGALLSATYPYTKKFVPRLLYFVFVPLAFIFSTFVGYAAWYELASDKLIWSVPVHLRYGETSAVPTAEVLLPHSIRNECYRTALRLVIPTTDANIALGNFMISVHYTLYEQKSNHFSALIPPHLTDSWWLFKPRTVAIDTVVLPHFCPGWNTESLQISVGRQDQWKTFGTGPREVSVMSASLHGIVADSGLIEELEYRFPVLAGLIFATIAFSSISLVLGFFMLPFAKADHQAGIVPKGDVKRHSEQF